MAFPGNLVVKMDGGRNLDGNGWGEFVNDDSKPWGLVLHTTETAGVPRYLTSSGQGVHPHYTYDAPRRVWVQHNRLNKRAGTLRGTSTSEGGRYVPTNAAKVIQVEIVCYSSKSIADQYGRLWVGNLTEDHLADLAAFIRWLHGKKGIPLKFYPKAKPYGAQPMSHDDWWHKRAEAGWGICEHATAADYSSHWDCGALDSGRLMELVHNASGGGGGATPEPDPGDPVTDFPLLQKVYPYPPNGDDRVKVWQGLLLALDLVGWVDGKFGPNTERGTKTVQARAGLPQTGQTDEKTWLAAALQVR